MTLRARLRGSWLRERRRALAETQQQFADACGIARDQYAKAESGSRSLPTAAAILVARRLEVHVEDLYELVEGGRDDDRASEDEPPLALAGR